MEVGQDKLNNIMKKKEIKIGVSEAKYKQSIRDRERLKKLKVAVKPINQILKNIK